MCSICGIIDFSAKTSNLEALVRMWKMQAPLGRGYTYSHGGVALSSERTPVFSATHSGKKGKNRSIALGSDACGFFAEDLLFVYESEGLSALRTATHGICFALVDEKEKLLVISAADEPLYYAELGGKIIFASKKEALASFDRELPLSPSKIAPRGIILYSKT